MQLVFFVTAIAGITITINANSKEVNNFKVSCSFNSGGGQHTVHIGDTLTFTTSAQYSITGGWEADPDEWGQWYSFQYGIFKNDVLNFVSIPDYPTYTSPFSWSLKISEIIWTGTPTITIAPISFQANLRKATDEYSIWDVDDRALYELKDGSWTWLGETAEYSYDCVYEYDGYWRIKQYSQGPATMYGFQKSYDDDQRTSRIYLYKTASYYS